MRKEIGGFHGTAHTSTEALAEIYQGKLTVGGYRILEIKVSREPLFDACICGLGRLAHRGTPRVHGSGVTPTGRAYVAFDHSRPRPQAPETQSVWELIARYRDRVTLPRALVAACCILGIKLLILGISLAVCDWTGCSQWS